MKNKIKASITILKNSNISILDAARLIKNITDFNNSTSISNLQFCAKIIETGLRHYRTKEMSITEGLKIYISQKTHLRPESYRDIRYLSKRLIKRVPEIANRNFSELSRSTCEHYLSIAFQTPSQFNKGRAMLHALFNFAIRKEWCDKNPITLIERHKINEKEITPLSIKQTRSLLSSAQSSDCFAAVALLIMAGIRPNEVRRLSWNDIDLSENSITIRAICSKTGGVRQIEISPALKKYLIQAKRNSGKICPTNWQVKWRYIRNISGFKDCWTQDILRHTYASYHAKYYKDLSRLQLNMGHRNQYLLRSRYINMKGISKNDAYAFFKKL